MATMAPLRRERARAAGRFNALEHATLASEMSVAGTLSRFRMPPARAAALHPHPFYATTTIYMQRTRAYASTGMLIQSHECRRAKYRRLYHRRERATRHAVDPQTPPWPTDCSHGCHGA